MNKRPVLPQQGEGSETTGVHCCLCTIATPYSR